MPKADILANKEIYRKPMGGNSMSDTTNKPTNGCNCGCQEDVKPSYPCPPSGYWYPDCPPPPINGGCCPPPYPYPCPPVNPGVGSIEAQIAKLSKKSATIRKMIENLVNRNKSIIISIGPSYNFGTYTTGTELDKTETEYGKAVLEMLQTELEAIKAKIIELTGELEVADEATGGVESTVTTEL